MKQELFETISRITGHDCVDSELNEIIDAMPAEYSKMDIEELMYMSEKSGSRVIVVGCNTPKTSNIQKIKNVILEMPIHNLCINSELYTVHEEPKRGKRDRKTWQPQKYMNGIKK